MKPLKYVVLKIAFFLSPLLFWDLNPDKHGKLRIRKLSKAERREEKNNMDYSVKKKGIQTN
ncbi:MAG: hypothetical protein ACI85I_001281 [Arenicella sp.]|jgi:hypothetical protein